MYPQRSSREGTLMEHIQQSVIENRFLVGIHYKVPLSEIPTVFEPAYTALGDLFKKQGVAPAAHVAYYYEISSGVIHMAPAFVVQPKDWALMEAACGASDEAHYECLPSQVSGMTTWETPSATVAFIEHRGSYSALPKVWSELEKRVAECGEPGSLRWEEYMVMSEQEEERVTRLYWSYF
ncbi:hypothetical protein CULC809_01334 [Corynebacterium ulcerans 809]|nr:hypothetical protein CULC809_01334 [Corynebacterium ulcerans 809]